MTGVPLEPPRRTVVAPNGLLWTPPRARAPATHARTHPGIDPGGSPSSDSYCAGVLTWTLHACAGASIPPSARACAPPPRRVMSCGSTGRRSPRTMSTSTTSLTRRTAVVADARGTLSGTAAWTATATAAATAAASVAAPSAHMAHTNRCGNRFNFWGGLFDHNFHGVLQLCQHPRRAVFCSSATHPCWMVRAFAFILFLWPVHVFRCRTGRCTSRRPDHEFRNPVLVL